MEGMDEKVDEKIGWKKWLKKVDGKVHEINKGKVDEKSGWKSGYKSA